MNQDEVTQLARELLSQIVPDLKENLSLTFIEEGGEPILVATAGTSVLHLNAQKWAEKIISEHVDSAKFMYREVAGDVEAERRLIIRDSKRDIIYVLFTVHLWLGEALWILKELSRTLHVDADPSPFYRNVPIGLKWSIPELIDGRLRELIRLPEKDSDLSIADRDRMMPDGKYDYAITDTQMLDALKQLESFSIRGLAKLLAPEKDDFRNSVYDWMRRKGLDRAELKKWWDRLHGGVEKSDQSSDSVEKSD